MIVFFLVFCSWFQVDVFAIIPGTQFTNTGCYGNTADDFLEPSCNDSSVMAITGIYALAKLLDTNCPDTATAGNRDEEKCCTLKPEDCQIPFRKTDVFFDDCTGRTSCKEAVDWTDTTCNDTYLSRTNYMMMEYYCINDSVIATALDTTNDVINDTAVYIYNSGYPAASSISGNCSVSASCDTTLVITRLHLNLQNAGTCSQSILLSEDNFIIDCSDNDFTDYNVTDLYVTKSHFEAIVFDSDSPADIGQMWLQVRGNHPNSTVELRCGTSAEDVPIEVPPCGPITTPETTLPTTESSVDPSATDPSTTDPSVGRISDAGTTLPIVLGTVVPLVVLAAAGATIFFIIRKNKIRPKGGLENEDDGLPKYAYGKAPVVGQQHAPVTAQLPDVLQKA